MASGVDEEPYEARQIQPGIFETIFSALPTEDKARKREQERRRKYKEKLMTEHHGALLIDSSYLHLQ